MHVNHIHQEKPEPCLSQEGRNGYTGEEKNTALCSYNLFVWNNNNNQLYNSVNW